MNDARRTRGKYVDLLFFFGLSLLLCHELDAVAHAEWRLLPFLKGLEPERAYPAFVILHIPLLALLIWLTASQSQRVRIPSQLGVDAFMIVHVGLHLLFAGHEDYTFHSVLSETLIFGAGAVGLLHTILMIRATKYGTGSSPDSS